MTDHDPFLSQEQTEQETSRLTRERPDIWTRGLSLATGLTGVRYLPKLPLPDGTIYACGGGYYTPTLPPKPPKPKTPKQVKQERISEIDKEIAWRRRLIKERTEDIDRLEKEIADLEKDKVKLSAAPFVFVPDGAMEWLLHEVGHWVAASSDERQLTNYGNGHELEAWAFEEIILGSCGPARGFAPVTQRDGTAFDWAGPLPGWAFRHIDAQIRSEHVAVEQFRMLWAEWVRWGAALGPSSPWSGESS